MINKSDQRQILECSDAALNTIISFRKTFEKDQFWTGPWLGLWPRPPPLGLWPRPPPSDRWFWFVGLMDGHGVQRGQVIWFWKQLLLIAVRHKERFQRQGFTWTGVLVSRWSRDALNLKGAPLTSHHYLAEGRRDRRWRLSVKMTSVASSRTDMTARVTKRKKAAGNETVWRSNRGSYSENTTQEACFYQQRIRPAPWSQKTFTVLTKSEKECRKWASALIVKKV